jgi:hypothetical protein
VWFESRIIRTGGVVDEGLNELSRVYWKAISHIKAASVSLQTMLSREWLEKSTIIDPWVISIQVPGRPLRVIGEVIKRYGNWILRGGRVITEPGIDTLIVSWRFSTVSFVI